MELEFKDILIGLISPLLAAAFVSFSALRKFKYENKWNEKLACYKSIVCCIQELQMYSGEIYRINIGGVRWTNLDKSSLESSYYQNIRKLRELISIGELLIDYSAIIELDELSRELSLTKMILESSSKEDNDNWSLVGHKSEEMIQHCESAIVKVIALGKKELK